MGTGLLENTEKCCRRPRFLVFPIQPSKQSHRGKDLFRERLDAIIDLKHPLVRLAELVPWSDFDAAFGRFCKPVGRLIKVTRLMVWLHYLKHSYALSDEKTVERWVENPY